MGIEDPDADVAEQRTPVLEDEDDEETVPGPEDLPEEADPADVAEQRTEVRDEDGWDRG